VNLPDKTTDDRRLAPAAGGAAGIGCPDAAAPSGEPLAVDVQALLARGRRWGGAAIVAWVLAFLIWAVWAPIAGAVVGQGLVTVEASRQTVTHRDGGTVLEILVREGDVVRRGQTLLLLEDARVDATVDALRAQLAAEQLRRSRLEAEAALQPSWQARVEGTDARLGETIGRERAAFEARRRTWQGQAAAARGQIADLDAEIAAHRRHIEASAEAVALLREELASNEALLEENFVNRARVLTIRRGVTEYEARIQASRAELAQASQRRTELAGRIDSLRDAYVQTASEDLRDATARVVDLEEKLRAAKDSARRQRVDAPTDGRLVDLRVNTVGSAIGALEPIVDIVPAGQPLVVEVRLSPSAASDVVPGQAAEVRVLSGHQRAEALLPARITHVAGDALTDARTGMPYVTVQAEVDAAAVAAAEMESLVAPGRAAEVYVRTVERSPLGFLMEPLVAGMRRAFREH
jgi:HlyD family type I secretion membrane fusion protein